ncbi:hypothetical protein EMIT0324P_20116 [Pseudomonas chlororaphis]
MEILRLKYDICNILLQLNLRTDRQVRPGLADNAGVWRGGVGPKRKQLAQAVAKTIVGNLNNCPKRAMP